MAEVVKRVPVLRLNCRPDEDAVYVLKKLFGGERGLLRKGIVGCSFYLKNLHFFRENAKNENNKLAKL